MNIGFLFFLLITEGINAFFCLHEKAASNCVPKLLVLKTYSIQKLYYNFNRYNEYLLFFLLFSGSAA